MERENDGGAVVNHLGQCVADLDRSVRFYVELLGFHVERNLTIPDDAAAIADRILFLADGQIVKDLGPSSSSEILDALQEVTGR